MKRLSNSNPFVQPTSPHQRNIYKHTNINNSMSNGAYLDVVGRKDPKLGGHLSSSSLVNS